MVSHSKRIKLTKKALRELPFGLGWINVDDPQISRLKVYSGKTKKVIYIRRRVKGGDLHFKVCDWGSGLSPKQIRGKATVIAVQVANGENPNQQKKADSIKNVTLEEAYQLFVDTRTSGKNAVKASTREQWQFGWKTDLQGWADMPMVDITANDVQQLHKARTKTSPSRANFAVRLLGQIFRVAMATYEDENHRPIITYDPTQRISALKLQNKIPRRTGHIPADKLEGWFEAVQTLPNEAARDLLVFTVLTGLRRNEAAQLTWDRVDLDSGVYRIVENKSKRPVALPLSDYLADMLKRRKCIAGTRRYVFPAGRKSGYLRDWRSACNNVGEQCGVKFTPHDLRRTFITHAESLDTPIMVLKMLVNHALPKDDVTSGYVQMNVERMRVPLQRINDHILRIASVAISGDVVQFPEIKQSSM